MLMEEGCIRSSVPTNASPQRGNALSPQMAISQQPSGATPQRNRPTHNRPLTGIRASFCWAILTLWHQSSIPKLPCKTQSLTTHYKFWTTSNVPMRTREWYQITAVWKPPHWLLLFFTNTFRLLNTCCRFFSWRIIQKLLTNLLVAPLLKVFYVLF